MRWIVVRDADGTFVLELRANAASTIWKGNASWIASPWEREDNDAVEIQATTMGQRISRLLDLTNGAEFDIDSSCMLEAVGGGYAFTYCLPKTSAAQARIQLYQLTL